MRKETTLGKRMRGMMQRAQSVLRMMTRSGPGLCSVRARTDVRRRLIMTMIRPMTRMKAALSSVWRQQLWKVLRPVWVAMVSRQRRKLQLSSLSAPVPWSRQRKKPM